MGKLLPGGVYQADNGLRYRDYQSAVNAGNIDRTLKQVGSSIFQGLSNPLGIINQYEAARKRGFGGGRSAAAGTAGGTGGEDSFVGQYQRQPQGSQRPAWEQKLQGGGGTPPPPLDLPAPITSPNTTFQRADEEYKTLLSQYGGTSGVQQLAGMQSLPTGFTPTGGKQAAGLEDYYAAQRAVGAKNIGEITGALAASDPRYQKGGTLEQWAKANPMLAMREFNKKFPAGAPTQGPNDEAIRAAMGGGTYFPSEGSPSPVANAPSLAGQTSFGNIANPVAPTKAWNQGAMVDANRGKENLVPQQEAKTTPDGTMPNLETTAQPQTVLDKTGSFLNNINSLIKTIAPTGLSSIIYNPYQ